MGRKKSHPIRSRGISEVASRSIHKLDCESNAKCESEGEDNDYGGPNNVKPFYVEVDNSSQNTDDCFDIAEIYLDIIDFVDEETQVRLSEEYGGKIYPSLRFSLYGADESSFKMGHWPVIPADSIVLEGVTIEKETNKDIIPFFSGIFDGPNEGVSGLVHLVGMKFVTLSIVDEFGKSCIFSSMKLRVGILRSAFEACNSLCETVRQPWRKSMMNAMSWLRPDVVNSEAVYRIRRTEVGVCYKDHETTRNAGSSKHAEFDASGFYEAIKPSKDEPMLDCELPDLLPHLRPYQKRAAYWMVRREKGGVDSSNIMVQDSPNIMVQDSPMSPFNVPVKLLERDARLFYNPFNGNVSPYPEYFSSHVSGGILADEMGLGKTVELLACIFTHRRLSLQDGVIPEDDTHDIKSQIKRQRQERVECICGAASENPRYRGLWVQCDNCDAWQHADCVGYSPKKKSAVSQGVCKRRGTKSEHHMMKKGSGNIIELDESYICSLCSELMEAVKTKTPTGATLVVCPAPILAQWHSEVIRHTRPGSLKICIYEGARNLTSYITLRNEMMKLATSDVVLTTYDVLKEDLSHDSDRHEGDRRFMRFQKKYPVIPTLLTRIHWWRVCLDEAQMVECNTASVTEMAMRLSTQHRWCVTGTPIQRKLDDMYGLLRFLRASPFDVYRWWAEVIRDPYERRDFVAMEFVHRFFKKIMWRSSKVHVSDELQLPSQEDCLSWLTFSPVEEHFYQKQHATCVTHAHQIISSCKTDICERNNSESTDTSCNDSPSHNEVERLLVPLLKLRQACCHPQVGSSGLCSLQRSPLTMEEILDVLIGKTKIEGEEALRVIVVALNGLAGIAIIEKDINRAVSLYKEALALADEHCNDFRLDPLLSIHILHNLAELIPDTSEYLHQCPLMGRHSFGDSENRKTSGFGRFAQYYVKRRKISDDSKSDSNACGRSLEQRKSSDAAASHMLTIVDSYCQEFFRCYNSGCLKKKCETFKQKYLALFGSKLSLAQQEFKNSNMQVSSIYKECKNQNMSWWLHALDLIEENKDSSELLKRIDTAISSVAANSKSVKISSRIRNIAGLKYTIQTGLDSLDTSRRAVINRILEIDQTMERPNISDIELKRCCPNCNNGNGSLCISCELDQLFQVYEAGLFLVKKTKSGVVIASEDAINIQRQKTALNRFFRDSEMSIKNDSGHEKNKQRNVREDIQVSKSPSPLEITLGIIKSFSKKILGREGVASARKHLLLFEAMRKEYAQARCLSVAQSQFLGAHDEIRMSTTRMRLKETEDEPPSITVLNREDLISHSMQYSSDKFLSLTNLSRIKGQLRYLKGLVVSNQKVQKKQHLSASKCQDKAELSNVSLAIEDKECISNADKELCPICHDYLCNKKMVFPCGHVLCCKCCLKITEKANVQFGKCQRKWIMCPTCRQQTDPEAIAYVDEKRDNCGNQMTSNAFQAENLLENSSAIKGSYGTKIEAVTRRILWITSTDEEAKVLVFSSWNDVLDVLSHALDANNITYVRMKGGRKSQDAIAKFKGMKNNMQNEDKSSFNQPIRVLLMLIQHGANGLNILEAQHVILVEPLLNPAAEAQAISRVHRVGQEKQTFVHRFMVKDSVEESIYKLNRSRNANPMISTKAKNKHDPILTIQDVESLFPIKVSSELHSEDAEISEGSLRRLPPSVASGLAAERRLMESRNNSTNLELE